MRQYLWFNREILQKNVFNILKGPFSRPSHLQGNILTDQRDMTELKLVWSVNKTGHRSKIILSVAIFL